MALDVLKQNTQSILDGIRAYNKPQQEHTAETKKKKEELIAYLAKLCYTVQKGIDDERSKL